MGSYHRRLTVGGAFVASRPFAPAMISAAPSLPAWQRVSLEAVEFSEEGMEETLQPPNWDAATWRHGPLAASLSKLTIISQSWTPNSPFRC